MNLSTKLSKDNLNSIVQSNPKTVKFHLISDSQLVISKVVFPLIIILHNPQQNIILFHKMIQQIKEASQ